MTFVATDPAPCTNCGRLLAGAFCGSCGQKVSPSNPSILDFVHELAHELLHVDGKIFRSVRLLVTAPGELTRELFKGRRVRYVSPIRIYLVFSVLYFAAAALTPDVGFRITVGGQRTRAFSVNAQADRPASNPDELRKIGFESQQALEAAASEAIVHWAPRAMFLLVPLFAALIGVTVQRSGHNYPQQLYFALHVHAAWFLFLALGTAARLLPWRSVAGAVSAAVFLWMFLYLTLALRRAYSMTIGRALWRALVVGCAYGLILVVTMISIVLPVVLRHR
jgi:hypothetical protein